MLKWFSGPQCVDNGSVDVSLTRDGGTTKVDWGDAREAMRVLGDAISKIKVQVEDYARHGKQLEDEANATSDPTIQRQKLDALRENLERVQTLTAQADDCRIKLETLTHSRGCIKALPKYRDALLQASQNALTTWMGLATLRNAYEACVARLETLLAPSTNAKCLSLLAGPGSTTTLSAIQSPGTVASARPLSSTNTGLKVLGIESPDSKQELEIAKRALTLVVNAMMVEVCKQENQNKSLKDKVKIADSVLWSRYPVIERSSAVETLTSGLQPGRHKLDCDTACLVILALADEMALCDPAWRRIALVQTPDHAWLRIDGANIDGGLERPDDYYVHTFPLQDGFFSNIKSTSPLVAAYCNRGVSLGQKGKFAEAAAAFRKALEIEPNNLAALLGLGAMLNNSYKDKESLATFDRALQVNPKSGAAHAGRGIVLGILGRYQESLDACRRATAIDPTNVDAQTGLGFAAEQLDKHEEARTAFARAVALKPNHENAWRNLGAVLENMGEFRAAVAAFDRALTLDPNDAKAQSHRRSAASHLR